MKKYKSRFLLFLFLFVVIFFPSVITIGIISNYDETSLYFFPPFLVLSFSFFFAFLKNVRLYRRERNNYFSRRDNERPLSYSQKVKINTLVDFSNRKRNGTEVINQVLEFVLTIEDAFYFRPRDFIQHFNLDTNKLLDMYHIFDKVGKELYITEHSEYIPYSCFFYDQSLFALYLYKNNYLDITLDNFIKILKDFFINNNITSIEELIDKGIMKANLNEDSFIFQNYYGIKTLNKLDNTGFKKYFNKEIETFFDASLFTKNTCDNLYLFCYNDLTDSFKIDKDFLYLNCFFLSIIYTQLSLTSYFLKNPVKDLYRWEKILKRKNLQPHDIRQLYLSLFTSTFEYEKNFLSFCPYDNKNIIKNIEEKLKTPKTIKELFLDYYNNIYLEVSTNYKKYAKSSFGHQIKLDKDNPSNFALIFCNIIYLQVINKNYDIDTSFFKSAFNNNLTNLKLYSLFERAFVLYWLNLVNTII